MYSVALPPRPPGPRPSNSLEEHTWARMLLAEMYELLRIGSSGTEEIGTSQNGV
jgi:hypothetical protein